MKLKIKITTCNACDNCKIIVRDDSAYLSEESNGTVKDKFKFSDTVSIDVLLLNKLENFNDLTKVKSIIKQSIYTDHSKVQDSTLHVLSDGWFSLVHIVLPSKEWFDRELNKQEGSALGLYNLVYFASNNKVYKYINGNTSEVDLSEILILTPVNTTISKTSEDFISICFLRKCYINLCKQILNDRGFSSCWNKNKIDSELIYKRDLVWMAINVIKYLTECEQLAEVERLVEIINGCNGLCSQSNFSQNSNGCGCSK